MNQKSIDTTQYLKFKELHQQKKILVIGNVWNVQSAKVFEKLNFQAIGTSSAAIAHTLGYNDGQEIPFTELLHIVDRINKSTTLPLTVDMEFGYADNAKQIAENIKKLSELDVAGINIEDSFIEFGERKLRDENQFSQIIKETSNLLNEKQISIFINIRCDAFLLTLPEALQVAKRRITLYEKAGADGIFLPCLTNETDIEEIVSHTKLPLNVMCMPQLPNFTTLENIGVKRISMGNFLNDYTNTSLGNIANKILSDNSFSSLFFKNGIDSRPL